jgi:lipoprotein-anchoring transpeptidase ErfK/SrfK
MRHLLVTASVLLLAACSVRETDEGGEAGEAGQAERTAADPFADPMASRDPAPGEQAEAGIPDSEQRPTMQLQVVLERQGFGPGVIDGGMGLSTRNALRGFQEANDLEPSGELDEATRQALARWSNIPATRVVTIPEDWGRLTFASLPGDPAAQAQMEQLGYESLDEKLAERFHTTVAVLRELNPGGRPAGMTGAGGSEGAASPSPSPAASAAPRPGASAAPARPMFTAGQQIRVPNVGADRIEASAVDNRNWGLTLASLGVGTQQPEVARIVVDESDKWLKGYDREGKLVALFTVSTGSSNDPLPLGDWGVNGVAYNPPFAYDPELFWDVPDSEEDQQLPPGPNGPVGVVWIDLTKEHYGIHGTPAPETIGRAQSHGCVRLTNWDAARLAGMVSGSTKVVFQA